MATLQQLQTTCLSLLFSTQAHPIGFAKLSVKPENSLSDEKEEHLLGLYDKLEKVCLERRILEAEMSGVGIEGDADDDLSIEDQLRIAEAKLLGSRANSVMKGKIVETTLATQPVLRAVHLSSRSTAKERALSPLILRRDVLSVTHANLSHVLGASLETLSKLQASNTNAQVLNRQLTARLLTLSEKQKKTREVVARDDQRYRDAEEALRETKIKWEVMRNAVQAIIVGSGVDWVGDKRLRDTVLSCGEEPELA
ncbi:centromere protein H (CENP-H)-domain-containing protein [Tuber brumale]|nr:centromere protein H (CENP-H)-domain-containing protein [Tuber brumale]